MDNLLLIAFIIVGIIYFSIAIVYLIKGNYGMFIAFLAYAIANAGLYKAGNI